MARRSYQQICPVAASLDVVGERWSLLIVRELLFGPKRFTDLKAALPAMSPNLLAPRLKELEDGGVVAKRELPPPAARTVYELTPAGRELEPVIRGLARWGMGRLDVPEPDAEVSPTLATRGSVVAYFEPDAALDLDATYALLVDAEHLSLRVRDGRASLRPGSPDEPTLTIRTSAVDLLRIRLGDLPLDQAVAVGAVVAEGEPADWDRFIAAFDLRTPARSTRPTAPATAG